MIAVPEITHSTIAIRIAQLAMWIIISTSVITTNPFFIEAIAELTSWATIDFFLSAILVYSNYIVV